MTVIVGYLPSPEGRAALDRALQTARERSDLLLVINASTRHAVVDTHLAPDAEWQEVADRLAASGLEHEIRQPADSTRNRSSKFANCYGSLPANIPSF